MNNKRTIVSVLAALTFFLIYCAETTCADYDPPITIINSVNEYDNARWKDLSKIDLLSKPEIIPTLVFNVDTIWPDLSELPKKSRPAEIMHQAKNPGLRIRQIHKEGITGKGVNVAIIDQPTYLDHPEFKDKIVAYHDVGCGGEVSSMHGPAVASLLVGTNCGTAPGAKLYYVAAPSWTKDASYQAAALDWIIEQNQSLPRGKKIRVVSVSAAPSGNGSPFTKDNEMWDEACLRAEQDGIMVLDCTNHRGILGRCYYDPYDPEKVSKSTPGAPGQEYCPSQDSVLAPSSIRTVAEKYQKDKDSYTYYGRGGLSWTIPYVAGVLALGWEVNPELTAEEMQEILFKSSYQHPSGALIIYPKEFIRQVKRSRRR
ncbi:MAG: S8/S53 family peptidase [Planctomycetes bacterium]|nr:S8/S53 family peptidase [Planctomycetota bacterium]